MNGDESAEEQSMVAVFVDAAQDAGAQIYVTGAYPRIELTEGQLVAGLMAVRKFLGAVKS